MTHPPDDTVGQQIGQGSVNRRVGLAEDARQLRRVDKRHPAEGVEQLSIREGHVSRLPDWAGWSAMVSPEIDRHRKTSL